MVGGHRVHRGRPASAGPGRSRPPDPSAPYGRVGSRPASVRNRLAAVSVVWTTSSLLGAREGDVREAALGLEAFSGGALLLA